MYCKNLLKRQRKYVTYFYCKKFKKEITLPCDKNCLDFIFTKNKPIKKISKKRITVSKETYNKVLKRDKEKCRLLDGTCQGGLELHHIIYRSENKKLIDEADNCIMLCTKHHKQVHSNKHYWQSILKEMIKNGITKKIQT